MNPGDLVRIGTKFINTAARPGDVGLLISVKPHEKKSKMGWIDYIQHTHEVLAGGEIMLYREQDLEGMD